MVNIHGGFEFIHLQGRGGVLEYDCVKKVAVLEN